MVAERRFPPLFQGPLLPASAKGSASAAQFTFAKYMNNHRMKMAQTGFVKTIAMLGGEQTAQNRTKTMRLDDISDGEVSELEGEPFVTGKHGVGDCWKGKTAYPSPPAAFGEERHVEEQEQREAEEAEPEGEVEGDQDEAEDEEETREEERNIDDELADQSHAPECYALSPNASPEKLVVELEPQGLGGWDESSLPPGQQIPSVGDRAAEIEAAGSELATRRLRQPGEGAEEEPPPSGRRSTWRAGFASRQRSSKETPAFFPITEDGEIVKLDFLGAMTMLKPTQTRRLQPTSSAAASSSDAAADPFQSPELDPWPRTSDREQGDGWGATGAPNRQKKEAKPKLAPAPKAATSPPRFKRGRDFTKAPMVSPDPGMSSPLAAGIGLESSPPEAEQAEPMTAEQDEAINPSAGTPVILGDSGPSQAARQSGTQARQPPPAPAAASAPPPPQSQSQSQPQPQISPEMRAAIAYLEAQNQDREIDRKAFEASQRQLVMELEAKMEQLMRSQIHSAQSAGPPLNSVRSPAPISAPIGQDHIPGVPHDLQHGQGVHQVPGGSPGGHGGSGSSHGSEGQDEPEEQEQLPERRPHPRGGGAGGGGGGYPSGGHSTDSEPSSESEMESQGGTRRKRKDKMRMLKDKQLAQPEKYDGSSSTAGYRQWRERLRAPISAQGDGVAWEKILDHLEALRELIVTPEQIEKMMLKFHLKKRHVKVVNSNLYHMLQQYTKQTTAERVTLATKENAMDQYRMLYYEGMQVSDHALFLAKGRVWRVAEVKKGSDFAAAVDSWEQDRDFLQRHVNYTMVEWDQQYALLNICPADLRREVLKDYTKERFPTYIGLKQHIQNLITRDRDLQQSHGSERS